MPGEGVAGNKSLIEPRGFSVGAARSML